MIVTATDTSASTAEYPRPSCPPPRPVRGDPRPGPHDEDLPGPQLIYGNEPLDAIFPYRHFGGSEFGQLPSRYW
jgi:hypothetical protein